MRIVLVVDMFDEENNGTTMTARRFADMLRQRGHQVRVVSIGESGKDKFGVPEAHYKLVTRIGHKQGFCFATPDEKVFRKAFKGADIVHFFLPFPFERKAAKIARQMGIPTSAAFHLQPENITYNIHCEKVELLSVGFYRFAHRYFYKDFNHIHCPSKFIAGELRKNGYKQKLYVISNGVDDEFRPMEVEKVTDPEKFNILMIGRLSYEKKQDILLKAVECSKYADKIQVYLAGHGPCEKALRKQGETMKNPPIFGFYTKEELIRLINSCDLYVHAAYIESEAIACMEAFACGLVPVISNSPKSATVQFALDDRSLFEADNPDDLARKIDYWIENPEMKAIMSTKYAMQGNTYRVSESVKQAELMFNDAINDFKENGGYGR